MKRRDFVKAIASAPLAASYAGSALAHVSKPLPAKPLLILVELRGGNDGLNTVVPYRDPLYRHLRPTLAIPEKDLITLDDSVAFPKELRGLMESWDDGDLSIIQNVGYPNQSLSHFRGIDIWHTGSDYDQVKDIGWVAEAFVSKPDMKAITFAGSSAPFDGGNMTSLHVRDLKQFTSQAQKLGDAGESATKNVSLRHLLDVQESTKEHGRTLSKLLFSSTYRAEGFPGGAFGNQCQMAAQTLASGYRVDCMKLTIGGFDSHRNQHLAHPGLLKELAGGLRSLRNELNELGVWDETVILTYSEFGRRAEENGNRGTDHGGAAPMFWLSGKLKSEFQASVPALSNLDARGNLRSEHDFRDVYRHYLNVTGNYTHASMSRLILPGFDRHATKRLV